MERKVMPHITATITPKSDAALFRCLMTHHAIQPV